MSKMARRLLLCACFLVSFSANAFELDGAWTTDAANCSKIFTIINGKVSMTRNSDVYGGGFIVEKSQIRGQARMCKINSRREEGGVLRLIVFCSTEIAVLGTQQVDAKIDGDDRLTRIFPSFPDMGTTTYYRCKR